jgi:hypothetical protein
VTDGTKLIAPPVTSIVGFPEKAFSAASLIYLEVTESILSIY